MRGTQYSWANAPIPLRFANAPLARGFPRLSSPAQPSEMFLFLIGSAEWKLWPRPDVNNCELVETRYQPVGLFRQLQVGFHVSFGSEAEGLRVNVTWRGSKGQIAKYFKRTSPPRTLLKGQSGFGLHIRATGGPCLFCASPRHRRLDSERGFLRTIPVHPS